MGARYLGIEAGFLARRARRADLAGAVAEAAGHVGACGALVHAGNAIARALDEWCLTRRELPYHNRHHAAETALAMAGLCGIAVRCGLLSAHEAAVGTMAMLGHDLQHDGTQGGDGALEARSGAAVAALAAAAGLDPATVDLLVAVIRATNPALVADNAARAAARLPPGPGGRSQDLVCNLANEADICASLLPRLGPRMGRALAREWRGHPGPAPGVGTHVGRLAFLYAVPRLSHPAVALGLEDARAASLAAYAAVGLALCGDPSPEAGCAALDAAEPAVARATYGECVRGPAAARPKGIGDGRSGTPAPPSRSPHQDRPPRIPRRVAQL